MVQQKMTDRLSVSGSGMWVRVLILAFLLDASCAYAAEISPQDSGTGSGAPVAAELEANTGSVEENANVPPEPPYEYRLAARPDPFKPFIALQKVNPNELVDDDRELSGMQLFEPGQLSLVAVMDTPRGRLAMVEDVTKKGYLLREGVYIGRNGQVTEIRRDQVIVTETARTRGGEEIKTLVSMKLKRDGEGQ